MIKGASFVCNLYSDVKVMPPKQPGGSSMVIFSGAVHGPSKDADPTSVDCVFFVPDGKQMPFVVEYLNKGTRVAVIGADMYTEKGKDGRTYTKCKIANPYDSVFLAPNPPRKDDRPRQATLVAEIDNSTPF